MNREQVLTNIKTLTGESDNGILRLMVKRSESFISSYCGIVDIPASLVSTIEDLAIFFFRRNGSEAIKTIKLTGYETSFIDDIPGHIIRELDAYKSVRVDQVKNKAKGVYS